MLLGEYEHTLDDKNRLTLPARFRQAFAEGIVVTRGMDGCLFAYTPGDWTSLVQGRLATLDPLSKEGRRMQRFFYAGATEAELDKQGRVGIPARCWSTPSSAATSPSPASTTTSRSGIAPPGGSSSPRSKGVRSMLPNVLQPSATDHVPVLAAEVRESLAVHPGDRRRCTFGAGGHAALLSTTCMAAAS
jgi:Uncharacterized protein conserved in bacteria